MRRGETAELSGAESDSSLYRGRQWRALVLQALSTVMYYPLYFIAAPNIAEVLAGKAHKMELTGQFLGALFLGAMISVSARTELPDLVVPLPGGRALSLKAPHRLLRGAVAALAGASSLL